MTVTPLHEQPPCIRGCTYPTMVEGETPKPRPAQHGHYCNRCYHPAHDALTIAGPVIEHLITLIPNPTGNDDGSRPTKGNPPLPFNSDAFDDANETYQQLVYFAALWATRLNRPAPTPAGKAWRDHGNRVVGLPYDITPSAARYTIAVMAKWLDIHLDDILALPCRDDIEYFITKMLDIRRIDARWPRREQPKVADVGCPDDDCRGRILIYPPEHAGDDQRILCVTCRRHIMPADYERMVAVFRQVRAERAAEGADTVRARRTAEHLARKWAT